MFIPVKYFAFIVYFVNNDIFITGANKFSLYPSI